MTATSHYVVFVVEDDDDMREAIKTLLQMCGHQVCTYPNGVALLADLNRSHAGCIVMDVRMPEVDGLAFQRRLTEAAIALPVIMMSGYADVALSVKAMRQGAFMFLTKPFRDQDLLDAVSDAMDSERAAHPRRIEGLAARAAFDELSPREQQIMTEMTHGEPNKLIAARLELSEAMVKVIRARIMRKMRAASLPALTRLAERHGLC
ncbi:response regulator transcription factor [Sphingomonas sp. NPDC079357]|uniref:response regulator transcription factor n=1 Tax=Sphingomonas sp. NPDC079357 TaxID=3364518 RepID=UPI00384BDF91